MGRDRVRNREDAGGVDLAVMACDRSYPPIICSPLPPFSQTCARELSRCGRWEWENIYLSLGVLQGQSNRYSFLLYYFSCVVDVLVTSAGSSFGFGVRLEMQMQMQPLKAGIS